MSFPKITRTDNTSYRTGDQCGPEITRQGGHYSSGSSFLLTENKKSCLQKLKDLPRNHPKKFAAVVMLVALAALVGGGLLSIHFFSPGGLSGFPHVMTQKIIPTITNLLARNITVGQACAVGIPSLIIAGCAVGLIVKFGPRLINKRYKDNGDVRLTDGGQKNYIARAFNNGKKLLSQLKPCKSASQEGYVSIGENSDDD